MKTKIVISTIAACALVNLVGCGGGSSSSSVEENSKISGVAVDDLILNGIVTVADETDKTLAIGRTSKIDGSYTVDLSYQGAIVVSVSCDENSTMFNPDTNITSKCSDDVVLHSMVNLNGTDAPVSVNISPLTEVAYTRALAIGDGNLTQESMESARNQVALAFGIDPISTNPITNTTYNSIIGAIHTVADDKSTSVMDVTYALSESFKDGVIENTEEGISDIVEAIKENNISTPISDNNGSIVLPENPASMDDLAEAKDFVKELRTQVDTVKDFVDNEAVNIDKAFNNMAINIEYIDRITNDIAGLIGDMVDNDLDSISDIHLSQDRTISIQEADEKWSYIIKEGDMSWSGYVSFSDSLIGDDSEDEIFQTQTLSFIVDGELPLDETNTKDKQIVNLDIKTNITANKGATATIKGKIDTNGDVLEIKTADLELAYVEGEDAEPQFNYVKLNKLDVEGKAGGYTVDGVLDITSYVQNDYMKDDGGFTIEEHGGISGELECKSGADIDVSSIVFSYEGKEYQPQNTYMNDGKYEFRFEDVPANLEYNEWEQYITYKASCEDNSTDIEFHNYGSWGYDDEKLNNSGWLPNKANFTGSITSTTDSLNGVLSLEWLDAKTNNPDDEKDPEVKATLNGKLQMKDRPELTINLNLDTQAREFSADYTYDKTVINLTATETIKDDKSTVTYHTTNQLGDVLDIVEKDDAAISGSLTKDGKELGSVEEREDAPIIKYIDGSFETLF